MSPRNEKPPDAQFGILYPRLEAACLDLDGSTVDSEPLIHDCWREVCTALKVDFDDIEYSEIIGKLESEIAVIVREKLDLAEDADELHRRHQDLLRRRMPAELKPMPGIQAFIAKLRKAGVPRCLVTSARDWHAELALKTVGLRDQFRYLVTADTPGLKGFKPDPAPYVKALELMRVERHPYKCLALEDSPAGVRSALAAGMIVVAVPSRFVPREKLALAPAVHVLPDGQDIGTFELADIAHLLPQ